MRTPGKGGKGKAAAPRDRGDPGRESRSLARTKTQKEEKRKPGTEKPRLSKVAGTGRYWCEIQAFLFMQS